MSIDVLSGLIYMQLMQVPTRPSMQGDDAPRDGARALTALPLPADAVLIPSPSRPRGLVE